jgi:hypothetical protein
LRGPVKIAFLCGRHLLRWDLRHALLSIGGERKEERSDTGEYDGLHHVSSDFVEASIAKRRSGQRGVGAEDANS